MVKLINDNWKDSLKGKALRNMEDNPSDVSDYPKSQIS